MTLVAGVALAALGVLGAVAYLMGTTSDEEARPSSEGNSSLPDVFVAKDQNQPIVPADGNVTPIVRLSLEPGRYFVIGKVGLQNRDPALPFRADCWLVPSTSSGTPGDPGARASDYVGVNLAPTSQPGDQGQTSHVVTQELTEVGTVELSCRAVAVPNQQGAFTSYASISAIEAGSISTTYETATP